MGETWQGLEIRVLSVSHCLSRPSKHLFTKHLLFHLHFLPPPTPFIKNYLFLVALGLQCWSRAFSSCGERDYSVAMPRFLIVVTYLVAEHRLQGPQASAHQHAGLTACSVWLRSTWAPGVVAQGLLAPWHVGSSWSREPVFPALAGRFLSTVSPGKLPLPPLRSPKLENLCATTTDPTCCNKTACSQIHN